MPQLSGNPIRVEFKPQLTVHRGKLLSGSSETGTAVFAACFIRRRRIVIESELLKSPDTLRLILIHELFHFVWFRLSNAARQEFSAILKREREREARGELGESAAVKKRVLGAGNVSSDALWRDYVCESFCDSGAWLYSGLEKHRWFQLAQRWRAQRRQWLESIFLAARNC